jgi:hypothetical protein
LVKIILVFITRPTLDFKSLRALGASALAAFAWIGAALTAFALAWIGAAFALSAALASALAALTVFGPTVDRFKVDRFKVDRFKGGPLQRWTAPAIGPLRALCL